MASSYPPLDRRVSGPVPPTSPGWQGATGAVPFSGRRTLKRTNVGEGRRRCTLSLTLRLHLFGLTLPEKQTRRLMIPDESDHADCPASSSALQQITSAGVNSFARSILPHVGFGHFSLALRHAFHLSFTLLVLYRTGAILRVAGVPPASSARNSDPAYSGSVPQKASRQSATGVSPSVPLLSSRLAYVD